MKHRRALAGLAAVVLAGCAATGGSIFDAPPAGRVWDSAHLRFAAPDEVERRVAAADIALLGETHDNPAHHAIQRRLLRAAIAAGRRPALAMEQIDTEWQDAVDAALARGTTARGLAEAGHVNAGWSWQRFYAPIVEAALEARLRIVAINLSRESTRSIASGGLAALGEGEVARLGIVGPWNELRNIELREEIVAGHCGQDSPIVDKLVVAQRARDAVMADRILAHDRAGVVAILGRGHVRADLAVPLYLAARAPGKRIVTVALVEARPGALRPEDYPETAPGRFDFVWFTSAAARPDPCEGFKLPPR